MIQEMIYRALEHRFQANIDEAEATIEIYLNNSVGIGEHPQHLNEIKKHIDIISKNEGRLDILTKYFSDYNESRGNK